MCPDKSETIQVHFPYDVKESDKTSKKFESLLKIEYDENDSKVSTYKFFCIDFEANFQIFFISQLRIKSLPLISIIPKSR